MFRLFNLLFLLAVISACQKTDLSGHWHFFSGSNPIEIIYTWDIKGDTLLINKYNTYYGPDTTFIKIKDDILIADIKWYQGKYEYIFGFVDDTLVLILDDLIAGKAVRHNSCTYEEDALFSVYNNIDLLSYSEADILSRYNVLSEIFIGKPKEQEEYGDSTRIQVNDVFIRSHNIDLYIEQEVDKLRYYDSIHKLNNYENVTTHALFIDSETEMGFVDEVRKRLTKYQQPIAYITEGAKEDNSRYQALIKKAPHFCTNTIQEAIWRKDSLAIKADTTDDRIGLPQKQLCRYEMDITTEDHLRIRLNAENQYSLNNNQILLSTVADEVMRYVEERHQEIIIVLEYDGKSLYKYYLALLNEVLKAENKWKRTTGTQAAFKVFEVCSNPAILH